MHYFHYSTVDIFLQILLIYKMDLLAMEGVVIGAEATLWKAAAQVAPSAEKEGQMEVMEELPVTEAAAHPLPLVVAIAAAAGSTPAHFAHHIVLPAYD